MMKNRKRKKRVCICALNSQYTLYSYQKTLIREFSMLADSMYVVSGSSIDHTEFRKNNITYVEHISGFDIDKWRYVLLKYRSIISSYEELLLINDSFFGPFYDLTPVLDSMSRNECDFWGMTEHKPIMENGRQISDRFVQRYFVLYKKQILEDKRFWIFWKELPSMTSYPDTEKYYEFRMTRYLEQSGYRYCVLCNSTALEPRENKYYVSHILFDTYYLLTHEKLPVIPIYAFQIERETVLNYSTGSNLSDTMAYIKEHTSYAPALIYEYLLENMNIYDLSINLNLTKIFSTGKRTIPKVLSRRSIGVIAYLFYADSFAKHVTCLTRLPSFADIIVVTDTPEKMEAIKKIARTKKRKITVLLSQGIGRDWGALLMDCRELIQSYDYLCFLHDKKTEYLAYPSIGRSFEELLWHNMICSEGYLINMLEYFEENKWVGLAVPPVANHNIYFEMYHNFWTICFDETRKLAQKLSINTKFLKREKPPLSIGSVFWCRTDALKNIFGYSFSPEDFPPEPLAVDGTINHALERLLPYAAQEQGYLTVTVMSSHYAELYGTTNQYMLQKLLHNLKEMIPDYYSFQNLLCQLNEKLKEEPIE